VTVAVGEEEEEERVVGGLDVGAADVMVVVDADELTIVVDEDKRVDVDEEVGAANGTTATEDGIVIDGVLVGMMVLVTDPTP